MPSLNDVPTGGHLFLDANIFLEHLLRGAPTCTTLFQRLRDGEVRAVTSVAVLAEVRHRLLLTEAVRRGYVTESRRALDVVRHKPALLGRLDACDTALRLLVETPVRVVSVTPGQFRAAQRIGVRYHLLTNDALHVATLRAHGLRHLASADHDFARVPNLVLWTP